MSGVGANIFGGADTNGVFVSLAICVPSVQSYGADPFRGFLST